MNLNHVFYYSETLNTLSLVTNEIERSGLYHLFNDEEVMFPRNRIGRLLDCGSTEGMN